MTFTFDIPEDRETLEAFQRLTDREGVCENPLSPCSLCSNESVCMFIADLSNLLEGKLYP